MHGSEDVLLGWYRHRILLVVGEYNHLISWVSKVLRQEHGHILNIIDTTSKLAALTEIVDANEEGFSSSSAVGVLERRALRSTDAEMLHIGWRRRSRLQAQD